MSRFRDFIAGLQLKYSRVKRLLLKADWFLFPSRKQIITVILVVSPFLLTIYTTSNPYVGLYAVFVGVTISTDYIFPLKYISEASYDWIQNNDSLTEAIKQNRTAAEYAAGDYDPFELTRWESGNFWAAIPADRPIIEGMIFRIRCDVEDASGEFYYPIALCTARVGSVKAPAKTGGKREITMRLINWVPSKGDGARDKDLHTQKQIQLLTYDDDIAPEATLDITREYQDLEPNEWDQLDELLSKTNEYQNR
jgi:hypothetical protein